MTNRPIGTDRILAVASIALGVIIASLAAYHAPRILTDMCGVFTALLLLALLGHPSVPWIRGRGERRERAALRCDLRALKGPEADLSLDALPDGVYGYEVIFALQRMKDGGAKIKPPPFSGEGKPYPNRGTQGWGLGQRRRICVAQ